MKKYIFILIALLLVLSVGGYFGYKYIKGKTMIVVEEPVEENIVELTIDNLPEDLPVESFLVPAMQKAFGEKYQREGSDVMIEIHQNDGEFARGTVSFVDEPAGAMFLARYIYSDDAWELLFDGNGTVPCSVVDPIEFPGGMLPECWDEATQTSKIRIDLGL